MQNTLSNIQLQIIIKSYNINNNYNSADYIIVPGETDHTRCNEDTLPFIKYINFLNEVTANITPSFINTNFVHFI